MASPENISPIIILGPSTIGKSAVAAALATAANAAGGVIHPITADKYYMYAGPNIMLGIGLTPDDMREGHVRLRGSLAPRDSLPTPEAYADRAALHVDEIHAAGGLALIEGCSVSYGRALADRFGLRHTVRLSWKRHPVNLALDVQTAYRRLLDLGLYAETEQNLDLGLEDTYPMSSLIYRPTVLALKREITRRQADELIVTKWIDEAIRANQAFTGMGIPPITLDQGSFSKCHIGAT